MILTLDILFLVTITHLYDIKMILSSEFIPVGCVDLDCNNVIPYYITLYLKKYFSDY